MNWLNSNMHADDSDSSQSDSELELIEERSMNPDPTKSTAAAPPTPSKSNITKSNRYQCLICDKRTKTPIFNKDQCCLQCPHCRRSWCLEDPRKIRKPANLDLIAKRYLEIKFSENQRRHHDHHSTKHTLSWIGTNILGNLGDIDGTLHELTLAQNVQDPDLDSLRAQRRFGIHHPNADSYHATHPAIIAYLPQLDVNGNQSHKALLEHSVCPICQLHFVDGTASDDDELECLLSAEEEEEEVANPQQQDKNAEKQCKNTEEDEKEEDMFAMMHRSRNVNQAQARNQHGGPLVDMMHAHHAQLNDEHVHKTEDHGIVSVYAKEKMATAHNANGRMDIGASLLAASGDVVHDVPKEHATPSETRKKKQSGSVSVVAAWKPSMRDDADEESVNVVEEVKEEENENGKKECAVQESAMSEANTECVVRLWCGHVFHRECVIAWLSKQNTCPLCRYELPSNNPTYELKRRVETYDDSEVYHVMT